VQTAVQAILEQRYSDLTRIAYLVLDDGHARPGALLATARNLVQSVAGRVWATPDPAETYAELRRGLAGRLVGAPPAISGRGIEAGLGLRLGWRLGPGAAPAPAADGRTRTTLRKLSPHERLVYVLARAEGLAAEAVAGELAEHLVVTADDVTRTLADVAAATGLDADAQAAELRAFDPTVVRLGPSPREPRRRYVVAAAVLAVLVAATAVGYAARRQAPRPDDPALIAADLWRRERNPDVTVWPTQGSRVRDLDLLRRARESWRRNSRTPPVGRIYVMYAGELGDATTVILRDTPATRGAPLVAQYVERPLSRGIESVRQLGIGGHDLILIDALSNRFLVPPWRTSLRASPLNRPRPEWRDLAVRGGVSDALPWHWFAVECQFYVAFQVADARSAPARTLTVLASHVSASATPAISFRGPGPRRHDDTALDSRERWAAVRALACDGGVSLQESADLRVGELWRGTLPDRGGAAQMLTVERAGGAADQTDAALLVTENGHARGYGDSNSDHVLWADEQAAAVWWRSARSNRWYLVVAAAPRVPRYYVIGELGRHEPRGPSLVLRGPKGIIDVDERPVVQVVVHEPDGDRSVVTP
jgi:hypothetical protein